MRTIMENKSRFIPKHFIHKVTNICVNTIKPIIFSLKFMPSFSYFLHRGFRHFSLFYDKLENTEYSLEFVSSLPMKNEYTSIYIFLSQSQSKFRLMNMDYCRNSTICLSIHQMLLELSFQFSLCARISGKIFGNIKVL